MYHGYDIKRTVCFQWCYILTCGHVDMSFLTVALQARGACWEGQIIKMLTSSNHQKIIVDDHIAMKLIRLYDRWIGTSVINNTMVRLEQL